MSAKSVEVPIDLSEDCYCNLSVPKLNEQMSAGSNLAQTLLSPSKVLMHRLFLLNVSVVFVNAENCSVQNRVVLVKP